MVEERSSSVLSEKQRKLGTGGCLQGIWAVERRGKGVGREAVSKGNLYTLTGRVIDASVPHSPIHMDCNHYNCTPSQVHTHYHFTWRGD